MEKKARQGGARFAPMACPLRPLAPALTLMARSHSTSLPMKTEPGTNDSGDDRSRSEDLNRAAGQISGRLSALGIRLDGTESAELLGALADAVERFEDAVEACGGDLMVDEPPKGATGHPDDPEFILPRRAADESVEAYLARLDRATARVEAHRDA